eukprot:2264952-Rhodomonas_salina.1
MSAKLSGVLPNSRWISLRLVASTLRKMQRWPVPRLLSNPEEVPFILKSRQQGDGRMIQPGDRLARELRDGLTYSLLVNAAGFLQLDKQHHPKPMNITACVQVENQGHIRVPCHFLSHFQSSTAGAKGCRQEV